jgi:hypothetical protein
MLLSVIDSNPYDLARANMLLHAHLKMLPKNCPTPKFQGKNTQVHTTNLLLLALVP